MFLLAPKWSRSGLDGAGTTGAVERLESLFHCETLSPRWQVAVFFGGLSIKKDEEVLKKNCPHIVVGTPGRILALARNKSLNLKHIKHFILDECDKMLEQLGEWQCWDWAFGTSAVWLIQEHCRAGRPFICHPHEGAGSLGWS